MRNTITLNGFAITKPLACALLSNAAANARLGTDGPTLGTDGPTIEYSATTNTYLFIEGTMVTEFNRPEAVEYLINWDLKL